MVNILTSVDSVAYLKCNAANDSVLDTPKLVPKDDDHDLNQYQNDKYLLKFNQSTGLTSFDTYDSSVCHF